MTTRKRIFIAGHLGMLGSALYRLIDRAGDDQIIIRSRAELDLADQAIVHEFFESEKPEQVYLTAAKTGGILANNEYPAEFIHSNLVIQSNVIHEAWRSGTERLLFFGSSCIYPRDAPQPMGEELLMTGKLEQTNEPYAVAKIAGIKLCESFNRQYGTDFRSIMPANLYGPGDSYDPLNSHVIPALIQRIHEAKVNDKPHVVVWGSGTPRREFLYVDDMAEAGIFVMNLDKTTYDNHTLPMQSHINVGTGDDITISDLASLVSRVTGYEGEIRFDTSKPDGAPRKLLDVSRINSIGWKSRTSLVKGLEATYMDFLDRY